MFQLNQHLPMSHQNTSQPTDGLWDDDRKDEDQIGASYEDLEEAMENKTGVALNILEEYNKKNKHKMEPIPTFKL